MRSPPRNPTEIPAAAAELGSDGITDSPYKADATSFHVGSFLSTKMWCTIYTQMPSVTAALQRAATWKVSEDVLVFSDSMGRPLMRYARSTPKPFPPIVDYVTIDSVGKDTTGQFMVPVWLDTAIATDSGVWLDMTLPHRGVEPWLFPLTSMSSATQSEFVTVDSGKSVLELSPVIQPQKLLLVGVLPEPDKLYTQATVQVKVWVPWNLIDGYVSFQDRQGKKFTLLRPGFVLI